MYVCMYVCVCMYAMHVCMCVMPVCMYVCRACMYVCHACMYVCMSCMYVCLACVYVCVYVCMQRMCVYAGGTFGNYVHRLVMLQTIRRPAERASERASERHEDSCRMSHDSCCKPYGGPPTLSGTLTLDCGPWHYQPPLVVGGWVGGWASATQPPS